MASPSAHATPSPIAGDLLMGTTRLLCAMLGAVLLTSACARTTSVGAVGSHADAASDDGDAGDRPPDAPTAEERCTSTGGTVSTASCCANGTASFPDTCSIGACGCAPADSRLMNTCNCPGGCFAPDIGCVIP
jgi:hypothetical protein